MIASAASFAAAPSRVVSDELVSNLRCDQLNPTTIYKSIRPNAFDIFRRVTTGNFAANRIAHCWSIARWQRIGLLLGRQDLNSKFDPVMVADMIRGTQFRLTKKLKLAEYPLGSYQTFSWPLKNTAVRWQTTPFDEELAKETKLSTKRNYRSEIEAGQYNLFYRFGNLSYVFDSQSVRERAATLNRIAELVKMNKLPLVNMRFAMNDHHVVVVRSVKRVTKNRWEFQTFDSNEPLREKPLIATLKDGIFEITFEYNPGRSNPNVYIVGEEERPMLDKALVMHYRSLCAAAR